MIHASHISFFDVIVFIILAAFLVRGIWVGFAKQITFIVALFLGFAAAGRYHGTLDRFISPFINSPQIGFFIAYTFLFIAVYLTVLLIGTGLKKVMDITLLGWFDRIIGGLFGIIKAVFIASLLFMLLANITPKTRGFLRKSFCYPFLVASSGYILTLVKDKNLRSRLIPKSLTNTPDKTNSDNHPKARQNKK